MFNIIARDSFRRPELLFIDLLRKSFQGSYLEKDEKLPFLYRALVIAVDIKGGMLENPDANGSVTHNINGKKLSVNAKLGPTNPPSSIKARLLNGKDRFTDDSNLRIFWPFFPQNLSVPIKPGEHAYVIFEDSYMRHGLWICKVSGHDDINYSPGENYYKLFNNSNLSNQANENKPSNDMLAETRNNAKLSSLF